MIIDTSVIIETLRKEAEAKELASAIAAEACVIVGAPILFEARMVLLSQGSEEIEEALDDFMLNGWYGNCSVWRR